MTTKIAEDTARKMDSKGHVSVQNIQMTTGCNVIEFAKVKQGETKMRITIKAPNMDLVLHTMKLIQEEVKVCRAEVEQVRKNRRAM